MKRWLGFSVLVLTTLFATALRARSDEIFIIGGSLFQPLGSTGILNVEGTSGLRMDGALSDEFASLPWRFCDRLPCVKDFEISLRSSYGTRPPIFTGTGEVTLRGKTYDLWTLDGASADLSFDGTLVLPEFVEGPVEVSAPFTFSGALQVGSRSEPGSFDVFQLGGSGVATVTLVHNPFTGTSWVVASIRYDFAPGGGVIPR